ncbi:hypothetical protein GCM10023094_55410 [Rhodococcus olei]|uniref:Ig-like domain-containing protein n=1 Tax=Rhodococcus olei TaxID=2161675 RepID=A0ABP8PSH7_9NOCA
MRLTARAALVAAASIPLAAITPALASATAAGDVTFAYTVNGSTVTNTITNNSHSTLFCGTGLGLAPGGVLPPVEDILRAGQTLYTNGEVAPGSVTQTVTDVPDGSYVALASCSRNDAGTTTMWVSDYPGIADYLAGMPATTAYTVQQASTVVTVPNVAPPAGGLPDLGQIFAS